MTAATAEVVPHRAQPGTSLVARIAERYAVDPDKMLSTLKATAFKQGKDRDGNAKADVSNEQMMALLIVADQFRLNPFTKEIYAFADKGGIVPVVGVDGWARIVNEHPQFNGVEFIDGPQPKDGAPFEWIECVIHRKDRDHPVRVREYLIECKRGTEPWSQYPRRMLRHRAFMQCGRLAFGFTGIHDADEAEAIIEGTSTRVVESAAVQQINATIAGKKPQAAAIEHQASNEVGASIEGEKVVAGEATVAQSTPKGKAGKGETPGQTYGEVRAKLDTAKSNDDVDVAESLIASLADQFQGELRDLAKKRREELAA